MSQQTDDSALSELVLATVTRTRDEASLEPLRRALLESPHSHVLWRALGIGLAVIDRFNEAINALETALEHSPSDVLSLAYYGIALRCGGDLDCADSLFDFKGEILTSELDPGSSKTETQAFNDLLAKHIKQHPSIAWQPEEKATRNGYQTGELFPSSLPELARLRRLLLIHVKEVIDKIAPETAADNIDSAFALTAWGVVLTSGGYQRPHVHPDGILSGVYYVSTPGMSRPKRDDMEVTLPGGALRFRRTLPWIGSPDSENGTDVHVVVPKEGTVVIFPSFYWHDVSPYRLADERICIAFDVMPKSSLPNQLDQ